MFKSENINKKFIATINVISNYSFFGGWVNMGNDEIVIVEGSAILVLKS